MTWPANSSHEGRAVRNAGRRVLSTKGPTQETSSSYLQFATKFATKTRNNLLLDWDLIEVHPVGWENPS